MLVMVMVQHPEFQIKYQSIVPNGLFNVIQPGQFGMEHKYLNMIATVVVYK